MNTATKIRSNTNFSKGVFRYDPERARPKIGQAAAEIQPFSSIVKLPNGLGEKVCKESVDRLNQILADTTLGLARFELKYSAGTLSHEKLMSSIELYGTKVAPIVREICEHASQLG